ncbi:MAG: superoxide dismutase family protein [Myxococcota bacterium]
MFAIQETETGRIRRTAAVALALAYLFAFAPGCGPGDRDAVPPEPVVADDADTDEADTDQATAPAAPPAAGDIQEESLPPEAAGGASARAKIEARSGSGLSGTASFEESDAGVRVVVKVSGASPGEHGVHIHAVGDCSAEDAKSAGGHFNPAGTAHGAPGAGPHHAGDFGNIMIGEDGTGTLEITSSEITLGAGANSIAGRAIIVHGGADDLASQPSGAAGPRIGCGVIR